MFTARTALRHLVGAANRAQPVGLHRTFATAAVTRPFKQVDVFTKTPYKGNPVAVVLDGQGLSSEMMLEYTLWTNLSECTFVVPPEDPAADYKVRIFFPAGELPFAGHPTLGTCHSWLEAGGKPKADDVIVQECGVGLVTLRRLSSGGLAFAAPPLRRSGPVEADMVERLVQGLGIAPEDVLAHSWCDNGPPWMGLQLPSAEHVLAVKPDPTILAGLEIGLIGAYENGQGDGCDFEVRAFFRGGGGFTEDPVTGSLNAALAQWFIGSQKAPEKYMVSQGTKLGRAGRVSIEKIGDDIWVGGESTTCVDGTVLL